MHFQASDIESDKARLVSSATAVTPGLRSRDQPGLPEPGVSRLTANWYTAILENNFRLRIRVIPAKAGIQKKLGPGFRRDDGNVVFGQNS